MSAAFALAAAGGWVLTRDSTRPLNLVGWTIRDVETSIKVATEKPVPSPYFTTPQLRIETGMHNARPKALAVDSEGQFAFTSAYDGTVRVWDLPKVAGAELELHDVLRVPLGAGDIGKLFALALSPDGRSIAVGGWLGSIQRPDTVFVLDRESGRTVRVIKGFPTPVDALAFSADGSRLAVGLSFTPHLGAGVRVVDSATGETLWQDGNYRGDVNGLAFDRRGYLATSSFDGSLRMYNSFGTLLSNVRAPDGDSPYQLSLNPSGTLLALGYADCHRADCPNAVSMFEVKRSRELQYLRKLTPPFSGPGRAGSWLSSVQWSADGRYLYAGGALRNDESPNVSVVMQFDAKTHFEPTLLRHPASRNTIFGLAPLGKDGVVVLSGAPSLGALSADGTLLFDRATPARHYGLDVNLKTLRDFRVTADGLGISAPGHDFLRRPVLHFDILSRQLSISSQTDTQMAGPCVLSPQVTPAEPHCPNDANFLLDNWHLGESAPRILPRDGGAPISLPLAQREYSRSIAVLPNGKQFVLGTEFRLYLFDSNGNQLRRARVPESIVRLVATPDGRLVVAALGDGTIRWYSMESGQELTELLAFFVAEPDQKFIRRRWVLWTPSGYYDASPGGEDLLGWHLNRGGDQSALFYPAGRFRDLYRRPDIVDQVLRTRRVPPPPPTEAFNSLIPPVLRILDVKQTGGKARVRYQLDWPLDSKREIEMLSGSVNGVTTRIDGAALSRDTDVGTIDLFVPTGTGAREISLSAKTYEAGISEPAIRKIDALTPSPSSGPGVLHALLVGVADYTEPAFKLAYADDDVLAIQAALMQQKANGLYKGVRVIVLPNDKATRANILSAMRDVAAAEGVNDTTMLFLAGHGATQLAPRRIGGQNVDSMTYYYLPYDGIVRDGKVDPASAISQFDITIGFLGKIEGRKVVFLDTCRFGKTPGPNQRGLKVEVRNEFERRLGSLLAATLGDKGWASIVYAASSDSEAALESAAYRKGHGAFTAALLDGLEGDPRLKRDAQNRFDQKQLGDWLELRVPEITANQQSPVRVDSSGPAFALGQAAK